MVLPDESVLELAALAGVALIYDDIQSTLAEICRIAVRAVPGADGASLTALSEVGPRCVASSDPWAESLDESQYEEHEGPCIDAARSSLLFRVRDMTQEARWPSYMPRAVEAGARSMLSIPTTAESKTIGALDCYSREIDAFGAEEVSIAEIVASHASLASQVAATLYHHKELADQLREAVTFRDTIEQAKGIIIGATRCDPDAAFQTLVKQSQHENRKLRDIAVELVELHSRGDSSS
jgi:GAF domain-containing protein